MSTQGQWLGDWPGGWFGTVAGSPPGDVTIHCTPGNAVAAGVTAAIVRTIAIEPGNAVADGVTATITQEGAAPAIPSQVGRRRPYKPYLENYPFAPIYLPPETLEQHDTDDDVLALLLM